MYVNVIGYCLKKQFSYYVKKIINKIFRKLRVKKELYTYISITKNERRIYKTKE